MGESQGRRRIGLWLIAGIAAVFITMLGTVIVGVIIVRQAKSEYDEGTVRFYQLKRDIRGGTPIQEEDLAVMKVPKAAIPAFRAAITADDRGRFFITGKKAPRDLREGEFLFYPDFLNTSPEVPAGYTVLTIPIETRDPLNRLIPSGLGQVTISGKLRVGAGPSAGSVVPLMRYVRVQSLTGYGDPQSVLPGRGTAEIAVPEDCARALPQLQKLLGSECFILSPEPHPLDSMEKRPELTEEAKRLLAKWAAGEVNL